MVDIVKWIPAFAGMTSTKRGAAPLIKAPSQNKESLIETMYYLERAG
jgi:hypothetical protein